MKPTHHTFLQTVGNLYRKDRCTEWWTITDESRFYEHRHTIPFRTLYCKNVVVDEVVINDGLSAETIQAIQRDLRRSYALIVDHPVNQLPSKKEL